MSIFLRKIHSRFVSFALYLFHTIGESKGTFLCNSGQFHRVFKENLVGLDPVVGIGSPAIRNPGSPQYVCKIDLTQLKFISLEVNPSQEPDTY